MTRRHYKKRYVISGLFIEISQTSIERVVVIVVKEIMLPKVSL